MSIREMQRYAELREKGDATSLERRKLLEDHQAAIAAKIVALQKAHALLTHKITNYKKIEERIRIGESPACRAGTRKRTGDSELTPAVPCNRPKTGSKRPCTTFASNAKRGFDPGSVPVYASAFRMGSKPISQL